MQRLGKKSGYSQMSKVMITSLLIGAILVCTGCSDNEQMPVLFYQEAEEAEKDVNTQESVITQLVPEPLEENMADNQTQEEVEDIPETVSITITAAGDVTLGTHKEQDYWSSFTQVYDEAEDEGYFFENVYDIFSQDDFSIVNLEGPLTLAEEAREGQVYSIKGDPSYANLLVCGDIEAVSMANNHRLDYGQAGSEDTVKALKDAEIAYAYDSNVAVYEVDEKGIRIGFVSVNEVSNGWVVEKQLEEGIKSLKEQDVDLIFACCHWGIEREYYPEEYQMSLGRKCIDWGADLVIGHHPHVLQGIEEYQGKFIVYSLGNFCFGANRNPQDKDTMLFQQTFTFVEGEKQEDKEIKIIPCYVSSVTSRNDFKPTPATGAEAQRIIDRVNEYSKDFGIAFDGDGYLTDVAK